MCKSALLDSGSAAVPGGGQCCPAVTSGLDLAGLVGDGDRPSLVRSADGMLLLSFSFGGVLLGGLAQALRFGLCLFTGSV